MAEGGGSPTEQVDGSGYSRGGLISGYLSSLDETSYRADDEKSGTPLSDSGGASARKEGKMEESGNIHQNIEISSMLEAAMMSVLKQGCTADRAPNMEECQRIIQEWAQMMRQAIAEAGRNLEDLIAECERLRSLSVKKQKELRRLRERHEEMDNELDVLNENYEIKLDEGSEITQRIISTTNQLKVAFQYDADLKRLYEERRRQFDDDLSRAFNQSSRPPDRSNIPSPARGSNPVPTQSPTSSTPRAPSTAGSSPFGVTTTYDIGTGLSMRTSARGSPAKYQQKTTVESPTPSPETPRMIDRPINLNQTATLSPKTPWISSTRFGYTDPKERVFNLPPGFSYEGESIKKSVIVSSPERQQPLQVDIDVQPRGLTQTKSGEHFVCDVTLNMQELPVYRGPTPRMFQRYVPTWYHTPPIIPPEGRRKQGMFTPKSVFEKGNIAVRNIFGSDFESPQSPWGTGRTDHYDLDYNEPSPDMLEDPFSSEMDRSIEWEVPPAMNRTFTPPQGLNRTFSQTRSSPPSSNLNGTVTLPQRQSPSQSSKRESPQMRQSFGRRSPSQSPTPYELDETKLVSPSSPRTQSPPQPQASPQDQGATPDFTQEMMSGRQTSTALGNMLDSLSRQQRARSPNRPSRSRASDDMRSTFYRGMQDDMRGRVTSRLSDYLDSCLDSQQQNTTSSPQGRVQYDEDWYDSNYGTDESANEDSLNRRQFF